MANSHSGTLTLAEALNRARQALADQDNESAAFLYRAILKSDPQHKEALSALKRMGIKPESAREGTSSLTTAEQGTLATLQESIKNQNYQDAEQLAKETLIDPSISTLMQTQVLILLGAVLFSLRKLEEARSTYYQLSSLQPDSAQAHYNLAIVVLELDQPDQAVASFRKAIELNPSYTEAHFSLGNALARLDQFEKAILCYDRVIELNPNLAIAYAGKGSALEASGKHEAALASYEEAIARDSQFAVAYFNKGNIEKSLGLFRDSVLSYESAIASNPKLIQAYSNCGNALRELGDLNAAINKYNSALALDPNFAEAYYNRGNSWALLNNHKLAIEDFDKAIALGPGNIAAHHNQGNSYSALRDFESAIKSFDKAIELNPGHAGAIVNRASSLMELKEFEAALAGFDAAIATNPGLEQAHSNRGVLLTILGQPAEALQSFDKAIDSNPDYADAYSNRSVAQKNLGMLTEAISSCNLAIKLQPNNKNAHLNLGTILEADGRVNDAIASFNKAIEIDHCYAEAYYNRGNALQEVGLLDQAFASFEHAIELRPDYLQAYHNLLMNLCYSPALYESSYKEIAKKYGELATSLAVNKFESHSCKADEDILRIGLVSSDLRNHPVGYFLESVVSEIDSSKIQLIAFPASPIEDEMTARLQQRFSKWLPIFGLNDKSAANLIHSQAVHILIDLSGHTADSRLTLFAYKPAPIQVSWLGYFASTGLREMDYVLGDPHVTPPELAGQFCEHLWLMPESRWCFTPPQSCPDVSLLPALSNGYITFGCLNNLSKINVEVIKVWSEILLQLPASKLLLKAKLFRDDDIRNAVTEEFSRNGVHSQRIELRGWGTRKEYLETYNEIDICLDPFPFTGGTTSVESLWMGVPVLTLAGNTMFSRQGVGILNNAGLSQWIAQDKDEYQGKAVEFASNNDVLSQIRSQLRSQVSTSPLFDAVQFARHFESAMHQIWNENLS